MRTKPSGWVGIGVAALAAGCASSPAAVDLDQWTGRWEWQAATGGIAGRTLTPASEGYTMELRLTSGGDAELLRNGTVTQSATYELGLGRKGGSFEGRDVVRFTPTLFGSWEEMAVTFPDAAHLTLSDGCCDGFTYSFVRIGSVP